MAKHKHSELIKAWADGAEIQMYYEEKHDQFGKDDWIDISNPTWDEDKKYRLKPKKKPKTKIVYEWMYKIGRFEEWYISSRLLTEGEAKEHFTSLKYESNYKKTCGIHRKWEIEI
jgi:hypothetical protein